MCGGPGRGLSDSVEEGVWVWRLGAGFGLHRLCDASYE